MNFNSRCCLLSKSCSTPFWCRKRGMEMAPGDLCAIWVVLIQRVNGGSQILQGQVACTNPTACPFVLRAILRVVREVIKMTNILGFKRCVGQCLNFDKSTKAVVGFIHMSIPLHSTIDDASGCFPVLCAKEFRAYCWVLLKENLKMALLPFPN